MHFNFHQNFSFYLQQFVQHVDEVTGNRHLRRKKIEMKEER